MIWEYFQGERAAFPPRLMKDRNVLICSLYSVFFAGTWFMFVYFLPLYFQSVQNVSPTISGVHNLPLIVAVTVALIMSGAGISKTGLATPFMAVAAALGTIGAGLLFTLDVNTSTGKWIGYQIIGGLGLGFGYQVPVMVVQATVAPSDIASASAIIFCKLRNNS